MKVLIVASVFTITCVCYGEEVDRVLSEGMKNEDKKLGEENVQEKEPLREDLDFWKLNYNTPSDIFAVSESTKLGRIVVPDLPEEEVDLEHQSQNIFEIKENLTLAVINENNTITEDEHLTTLANLDEETETSTFVKFERQTEEKSGKSVNNKLKDILETTIELPTTIIDPERKTSNEVQKPLEVRHRTVIRNNCTSTKLFPALDLGMVKPRYINDQESKVQRFLENESRFKKFERRTFHSWNLLDFGDEKHGSDFKITKEIPYPVPYPVEKKVLFPVKVEVDRPIPIEVPKPYPVIFEKNVYYPIREYIHAPYPVFRKLPYLIQISVDKPIPFHISKPFPVYIENKVPYPVEKKIPIPIKIPVEHLTPVHMPLVRNVYYPIEKKVHYPMSISVDKPIAVPVQKPYTVYIEKKVPIPKEKDFPYSTHIEDNKLKDGINGQKYHFNTDVASRSFQDQKTEYIVTPESLESGINDGDFVPLSPLTNGYDQTLFQNKKDTDPQTNKGDKLQESMTTPIPLEKETRDEGRTTKTYHDFGRKIVNV